MKRSLLPLRLLASLAASLVAAQASACLPPPPGSVEPTEAERARAGAEWATDIVYGVVVRGTASGRRARFRVLHVYKGSLRPGEMVDAERGWGLTSPPCPGMMSIPPVSRGDYGVIAFRSDQPQLNFISDAELEVMFSEGLIRRARPDAASENRPR